MIAIIGTIISICNGALTLFKGLFGGKSSADTTEDAATKAVAMSNEAGKLSAQVSRDTNAQLNKELQNAQTDENADVASVRNAGSVRAQQSAVDDAISGANQDADSNH